MAVYEGNEKYVFISYAHKDSAIVLPVIKALQDSGFRVWYDGGIEAGTEWPEYIADHLARCGVALLFISENALASKNCIREINFAISEGRDMLAIYLSDVNLSRGMKMQLGTLQALYRRRFLDEESFIAALLDAKLIAPCKEGYAPSEQASEEEDGEDLSAFFGAEKQKKKARERATLDYADSIPIKIYKGIVSDEMQESITDNVRQINSLFADARIKALVSSVEIGPRVTTYYFSTERVFRLRQLEAVIEDLKFTLGVEEIRIIPPSARNRIPGIELLNSQQEMIYLEDILRESRLREEMSIEERSDTSVCLGRGTIGEPIFSDVAKFPHLLMSGLTQSGKTTLLHSMIISMITRVGRDRVRLILVDLKGVEFNVYNDVPHMLLPVIHDSASAARALVWLCDEMERRYGILSNLRVRSIDQYNELQENPEDRIPRIIFIVDDYTDLVYSYKKDIENSVMRLSQKSRAAGIHLILSTQKPDVNTITGVIKANLPARIAFRTLTQSDSRLIIDNADAVALNRQGDVMMTFAADPTPMRVHTPYISTDKIDSIVAHLERRDGKARYDEAAMAKLSLSASPTGAEAPLSEEGLLDRAAVLAIEKGGITTSFLQRKLSIGYSRAVRIIDRLEELGVIGEANGAKARPALITLDEWKHHGRKNGENDE